MFVSFFKAIWAAGGRLLLTIPAAGAVAFAAYSDFRQTNPDGWRVGGVTLPLPAMEPWWLWALFFLAGFLVVRLAWTKAKSDTATPRVEFDPPYTEEIPFFRGGQRIQGPFLAKTSVRNNPTIRSPIAVAEDAHINLEFFENIGGPCVLFLESARWSDNTQPNYRDSPSSVDQLKRRSLPPNNQKNTIDLFLKFAGDSSCYAFNVSTVATEINWKDNKYELAGENYFIKLTLYATGMEDITQWFIFKNGGVGTNPKVFMFPKADTAWDRLVLHNTDLTLKLLMDRN